MKQALVFTAVFIALGAYGATTRQSVQVCFTPGMDCESMFVGAIDGAKKSLDVQEYHLTNKAIVAAILRAKDRGVETRIILDKRARKEALPFINAGIPVLIDYKVRIAHNKVVIIDDQVVLGGSFNPSKSAQLYNAENLTLFDSAELAKQYEANFDSRERQSGALKLKAEGAAATSNLRST